MVGGRDDEPSLRDLTHQISWVGGSKHVHYLISFWKEAGLVPLMGPYTSGEGKRPVSFGEARLLEP